MKKWIFVLVASTTFAVLPPLAQSTKEMQAILSDAQFYSSLGSAEVIKDIMRTEQGYLVLTQHYAMLVDVVYEKNTDQKWVGPVKFHLKFHPPVDVRTAQPKA
jgi:hypothetical protein